MIESSKYNRENYPRKCFWTQERETRVKFNPRLSANRPSNNWAQMCSEERERRSRLRHVAMIAKFLDHNNLLEYSYFSLYNSGRVSMGKAKFYSGSILSSVVVAVAYPAHEFHTNTLFCFYSLFTCSAAVEAELSKKQIQLRGPEELQQATRFLHDNGNACLRAYNYR